MDRYLTGGTIKLLREAKKLTQSDLAEKLSISDKTVSKWETGKGFPDITMLEPISRIFNVSVPELLSGNVIRNANVSGNLLKSKFYVCPICGNIISSVGGAAVSCHGISLPPLEAEKADGNHGISIETVDDEYYVSVRHPMTKEHYISFIAALGCNSMQFVRLYPEGNAEARFKINMIEKLYCYCNRDGLFITENRYMFLLTNRNL